ncbi:MAG: hypothetical protein LBH43_05770 [Treponema sp.]|jgi:hypothetical protein|nr:hypothetical protein [Treponema sp.]
MNFFKSWYAGVENMVERGAMLGIMGISIAVIFVVIIFAVTKIRNINSTFAIAASALLSCFCMIPLITAFNSFVNLKVKGNNLDEGKAEIKALEAQYALAREQKKILELEEKRLEYQITIADQSIMISELNDGVKLLQNAGLKSTSSFQKIAELALLQTELKQTMVEKVMLGALQEGWGINADYYKDEALVVYTHDITAKFGLDLNAVKLFKLDGGVIEVSGLRSKFNGISSYTPRRELYEIRRVDYKGKDPDHLTEERVLIRNDRTNVNLAIAKATEFEADFRTKVYGGFSLNHMDSAVIQLSKNFLTVMLAPLYGENIVFSGIERPNALPLTAFLLNEIDGKNNLIVASQKDIKDNETALMQVLEEIEKVRIQLAFLEGQTDLPGHEVNYQRP